MMLSVAKLLTPFVQFMTLLSSFILRFQSTFPPVFMFPVLGKLLLPQRWSKKTSFFGSSRETDEC